MKIFAPVQAVFASIYEVVRDTFNAVAEFVSGVIDRILGFFRQLYDDVVAIFTRIKERINETLSDIGKFFGSVAQEANRLQEEENRRKQAATPAASQAAEAAKGVKVSDQPFGPALPSRQVDLEGIEALIKGSSKRGRSEAEKETLERERKLKQMIEDTLTPQERYNKAIAELNDLQPKTAEGAEAIRRKMAELRQELIEQDPVWRENQRLAEQFNSEFESSFKRSLGSIFRKGKDGFKDMLDGFKDLYFNILTEITARPILEALLGPKSTLFGGRSGGPLSDIFGQVASDSAGGGIFGKIFGGQQPANDNLPWLDKKTGETWAEGFTKESDSSTGFLGMLGSIFSGSGEGGGFLSNLQSIFQSVTGSLSSIFSGVGGIFSGLFGGFGGGGGGIGSLLSMAGSFFGNTLLPGIGGVLGSIFGGFFADGGNVRAGLPIMVGERGPELFLPKVPGEIIPHDRLRHMIAANQNFAGFFAAGGSVLPGMLHVVGERGSELFVPQMPSFDRQAANDGGGESPVIVNIHVTTPDTVTFRRSQGQIMTEAAMAIKKARRNL